MQPCMWRNKETRCSTPCCTICCAPEAWFFLTACTLQVCARWGALFQFQLQRRPGLEEVRLGQNNRAVGGVLHTQYSAMMPPLLLNPRALRFLWQLPQEQ